MTVSAPAAARIRVAPTLGLWAVGPALYLGTLALCARHVEADGYDGVGYVLALSEYDLGRGQPHPPGAPLFVLAGRLLAGLGLRRELALAAVGALLLGLGAGALAISLRRRLGTASAALAPGLALLGPLAWVLSISTLSDAAGAGALLLAIACGHTLRSARAFGFLLGLALAVRPQAAPIAGLCLAALALTGGVLPSLRAALGAFFGVLAWLLPYALWLGPRRLGLLFGAHLSGHFRDFGGGLLVDPHPLERAACLISSLLLAAFGPVALLALALLLASLVLHPPRRWSQPARQAAAALLVVGGGACLWSFVALPLRGHGRHLLPAALALGLLLALALGQALPSLRPRPRRALWIGAVLLGLGLAATSARTAWAARVRPAPGPALARFVADRFGPEVPLYGARAARHLDVRRGSGHARPALLLGEVLSDLGRLDRLPAEVLVTSEVRASLRSQARLRPLARFCYDESVPRLVRWDEYEGGCTTLYAYRVLP